MANDVASGDAISPASIAHVEEGILGSDTPSRDNHEDGTLDFQPDDPKNPHNWSQCRKHTVIALLIVLNITDQIATIIPAPVSPQILQDLNSTSTLYRTLLVSIWEIGEIVGALFYGPLSEIYGRRPVIQCATLAYTAFLVGCALSRSINMLIAFRFLSGATAVSATLNPAIVGDLYVKEERGRTLSTMVLATVMSPVIGPIIGGYLGQNQGWRWVFWLPSMMAAACTILCGLFFRETYKVRILARCARELNATSTEKPVLRSKYDTGQSLQALARDAFVRPMKYLITAPMLTLLTLQTSVFLGLTYLVFTVISPVFQEVYHFSEGASGLAFLGISKASVR
ncbi:MAG: hypothetical protein Q9159_003533 [Coniocarpon cinnabarinum]